MNTWWSARSSCVEAKVGKTSVRFIGRDSLILNKRHAARPQDVADLKALGAVE